MVTLGFEIIVALVVFVGVVCAVGGYTFANARQRRAGDGKSAQELKIEIGNYKEDVTEHFQTTARLMQELTEQYRTVYKHMANGAIKLCDAENATAQIERLRAGLLPASGDSPNLNEGQNSKQESAPTGAATNIPKPMHAAASLDPTVSDPGDVSEQTDGNRGALP